MKKEPTAAYQLRSKGPVRSAQASTEIRPDPIQPEPIQEQPISIMATEHEAPSLSGRPPFNIDLVGKFDPNVNEPKSWLTRYEYLGSVTSTSSDLLAKFFGMFLSMGVAFDWYTYLGDETKTNFDELKEKFLKRFSKRIDPIQITSEIFQMKQKTNQSVRDFVHEVQTKSKLADISIENTLSAINGGLLSHIRADLRRNPPSNLEQLIETAELSESAYAVHPPKINLSEAAFTDIIKNAIGGVNMLELKQTVDELARNQSINAIEKSNNYYKYDKTYKR